MIPAARSQSALEILESIESGGQPADRAVAGYLRGRRYVGGGDRRAILEQVYGVLRGRARLDWWLARAGEAAGVTAGVKASPRARLLAWLALVEGMTAAALSQEFNAARHGPAALSADELRLLEQLGGQTLEHPEQPEATALEIPEWMMAALREGLGAGFREEAVALMGPAAVDLRVNILKGDREAAAAALAAEGIEATPTQLSPLGLRLDGRQPIAATKAFREGLVEVQDEGSQLVALLLDAAPGMRVVDFCAGAGGKTLALAAAMANKGQLLALDVVEGRLKRAKERFRRSGAHNIETRLLRDERDPWLKRRKQAFDRVLVDAPCSGSGTWRRNPDAKWRFSPQGLEELVYLQGRILESAARLVRPGGRLVYATCSLLPAENERQVERFLSTHDDFVALPVGEALPWLADKLPSKNAHGGWLRLLPGRDGTDGFFATALQRREAP